MSIIEGQILNRVAQVAEFPALLGTTVNAVGNTVTGVVATALALATLGCSRSINDRVAFLDNSSLIVSRIFTFAIRILNPDATFNSKKKRLRGMFSDVLAGVSAPNFFENTRSPQFIKKEFYSRIALVGYIPALAIAKAADIAFGLIAVAFAVAACGFSQSSNHFAEAQLRSFDIVTLPVAALFAFINPKDKVTSDLLFSKHINFEIKK